jgi:hypothetical protein
MLRAWVDARGFRAGHVLCGEKSNELEAIPRLLDSLRLGGATVTIDAAGTYPHIAEKIHEAGADYVLALKANQKGARGSEVGFWRRPPGSRARPAAAARPPAPGAALAETLEISHGRCERREYQLLAACRTWGFRTGIW